MSQIAVRLRRIPSSHAVACLDADALCAPTAHSLWPLDQLRLSRFKATSGKDCPVIESGCSDESPGISTSPHFERFYHVPARLCACISSAAAAVANRRLTLGSVRHDWRETTSVCGRSDIVML